MVLQRVADEVSVPAALCTRYAKLERLVDGVMLQGKIVTRVRKLTRPSLRV